MAFRDLAHALLGLKDDCSEAERHIAARTAQVILADLIQQCIKSAQQHGTGALFVLSAADGEATSWATPEQIKRNLAIAERDSDQPMIDFQRDCLQRLGTLDPEKEALVAIFQLRGGRPCARLFELNIERDPERLHQRIEEAFQ